MTFTGESNHGIGCYETVICQHMDAGFAACLSASPKAGWVMGCHGCPSSDDKQDMFTPSSWALMNYKAFKCLMPRPWRVRKHGHTVFLQGYAFDP